MSNTKTIGEITEAIIQARLLQMGCVVLLPHGDNQRYDIVIEKNGIFYRIQCKTGKLYDNKIVKFSTRSTQYHRGGKSQGYSGQIEYFGVYCPQNDRCYLVPVADCGTSSKTILDDKYLLLM